MRSRLVPASVISNSIGALLSLLLLAGCASVTPENNGDPLEPMNRKIFAFNMTLDTYAIKPAAQGYRWLLPTYARDRIRNFLSNLSEPLVFANDLLQGRITAAGVTLGRFLVNTTAGLAGVFDVAEGQGMNRQSGDFGQTLYVWGVGDGPYIVLPVLGPSDARDALGQGVDLYANPIGHISNSGSWELINLGIGVLKGIDLRAQNIESFDTLQENSLDFYATLRSVFQQRRRAQLDEARPSNTIEPPLDDPGATPSTPAAGSPPAAAPAPAPAPD